MKKSTEEGLLVGIGLWLLTILLGIPLAFLQFGYNPRYLLQVILAIVLLVRSCIKPSHSSWIGLLTLEGLVLINAAFHFFRSDGFAMLIAGGFFGIVMLILLLLSGGLYLHKRDEC